MSKLALNFKLKKNTKNVQNGYVNNFTRFFLVFFFSLLLKETTGKIEKRVKQSTN